MRAFVRESVIAARASEQGSLVEVHTMRMLPTGCVLPSLKDTNVLEPAALASTIQMRQWPIQARSGGKGQSGLGE